VLAELLLQAPRGRTDAVEVGGRSNPGRDADHSLELGGSGRRSRELPFPGLADLRDARFECFETLPDGEFDRELAENHDRGNLTYARTFPDRLEALAEHEPLALVSFAERDQVGALPRNGLRRKHGAHGTVGGADRRRALELILETHPSSMPALGGAVSNGRAKGPVDSPTVSVAQHTRELFAPLGPTYDRTAALLSYRQDPRWRAFLVSRVGATTGDRILDVATGTGAVARELRSRYGCSVVGLDQSPEMLAEARRRLGEDVELVVGEADRLPFADDSFDGLTFTYLLRYVEDPPATLSELARVVRPGGVIAGLEFGLPSGAWRALWELHVRVGLPVAGAILGQGWREAGLFLGPSIRRFNQRWPSDRLLDAWHGAGIDHAQSRSMSFGGGVVTWGRKVHGPPSTP
jgi:demethylmenaquinone methyltransferase/2-methoxy-6-polyprenyl-1,4-benzoquinol methylase